MSKTLSTALHVSTIAIMLAASVCAQQTPPAKTQTIPAAQAQTAPAAKSGELPAAPGQTATPFANDADKFSYALGMNLGENLHRQSVDINPDELAQGVRDALAGGKTLMTDEEARAVLTQVQAQVREKQQEKMAATGDTNKKEGEAFLAGNKGKEGVVTLPSGLQYKIVTQGTGPKPTANDTVVCNYRGTLINGEEFDSSYKRGQPATFPVSGVIKGWTEALQLMPVGSKWQLFVPSDLAYAERGVGGAIGPNATLIFEVELLSIQAKSDKPAADKK